MLKIQSDKIIIDGHESTKEQCETMTLLANALAESNNFKTVEYRDGYAEFEKIGKADELKFVLDGPGSFSMYDSSTGDEVLYMASDGDLTITFSGNELTISEISSIGFIFKIKRSNSSYVESYSPSNGEGGKNTPVVITMRKQIENISENNITFAEASATPRKSIDLTTLPGWSSLSSGTHNITIVAKADGYRDSDPSAAVSVEKASPEPVGDPFITFTGESSDFMLTANKEWDGTVEYSTDTETWTEWDGSEISSVDQKLYLRGTGNTTFYTENGAQFFLSDLAGCSGNLNTLLEYSNPPTTLSADNCYNNMFSNCTSLTTAPALPATTLAYSCYYSMFRGCTSLTQAPELPATTLADGCYDNMFYGCTSLTTAPALPATTLADYCYEYMFNGCTSLTTAPALPATTLAVFCYNNMFNGCTSLTTAPELPATTLASNCYNNMFFGCTSLTTAPALPATTLANGCYDNMFYGCTSLTTAPALPATTLAVFCYRYMFLGCTSLTQAPELPATTLASNCYYGMFRGCTGLKISATKSTTYPTAWMIPSSGTISSTAKNWSSDMLLGTGGTFTSNPSINTTYYGAWTK